MGDFNVIRERIAGPVVCLPMLYCEDGAIDYGAMEEYAEWVAAAGLRCGCFTYGYSHLEYVTAAENIEATRRCARVFAGRTILLGSTRGETAEAAGAVEQLCAAGAAAVFVMPSYLMIADQTARDDGLYLRLFDDVAARTGAPVLMNCFGVQGKPGEPMVSPEAIEPLIARPNFIGLKDDVNSDSYRAELIRRYGGRLAMVGGGHRRRLVDFFSYPLQGELDGYFAPRQALRMEQMLRSGRKAEALALIDHIDRVMEEIPSDLFWLVQINLILYAMGFARTPRVRPPLRTPSRGQIERAIAVVRANPDVFEPKS